LRREIVRRASSCAVTRLTPDPIALCIAPHIKFTDRTPTLAPADLELRLGRMTIEQHIGHLREAPACPNGLQALDQPGRHVLELGAQKQALQANPAIAEHDPGPVEGQRLDARDQGVQLGDVVETRCDINNLVLLCESCHYWVHSSANTNKEFIHE